MSSIPTQSSECTTLGSLSLDLILSIAEHLPPSSIACLALTCKDLYASPPLKKLWTKGLDPVASPTKCYHTDYPCHPDDTSHSHERFQLMRRIKKDIPTHLFCDHCHKFHPKPKLDRAEKWLTCPSSNKATWLSWPKFDFHLQFEDISSVANHLRWGNKHGAPIQSIAKTNTDWAITKNAAKSVILCKLDVEPEVINDNLVLHTTQHTFFTERQLREGPCFYLDPLVDSMGVFTICKHQDDDYKMLESLRQIIDTLMQHGDIHLNDGGNGWAKSLLKSCDICTTHYCIEMAHHNNAGIDVTTSEGLEITLHTWMNLGKCSHNFSPCWLDISQRRNEIKYPAETIKKAKKISVDVFKRDISSAVFAQYARIHSTKTQQHPSLLPAIDKAVMAEDSPYLTKYNQITKILRRAGQNIHDIPMEIVTECELGHPPRRDLVSQDEVDALARAKSIIQDHKHKILAARSRWGKLGAGAKVRLSCLFKRRRSRWSVDDMLLLLF